MFEGPFQIRYLDNFSNSLILLEMSFILTFPMEYLAFLYLSDLTLVLKAIAVTNHFPDPSVFTFDSEDVDSILSRLSNFSKIFKILFMFKGSDERVTLNMNGILKISEKFDNLDKMETTSSESKVKMEGSGKWLVTALALNNKASPTKYKKARYAIGNVSMKDLSNKIKEFEKLLRYLI